MRRLPLPLTATLGLAQCAPSRTASRQLEAYKSGAGADHGAARARASAGQKQRASHRSRVAASAAMLRSSG